MSAKLYIRKFLEFILFKFNYKIVPNHFISWPHYDNEFKLIFDSQKKFGWKDQDGTKIHKMYKNFSAS